MLHSFIQASNVVRSIRAKSSNASQYLVLSSLNSTPLATLQRFLTLPSVSVGASGIVAVEVVVAEAVRSISVVAVVEAASTASRLVMVWAIVVESAVILQWSLISKESIGAEMVSMEIQ